MNNLQVEKNHNLELLEHFKHIVKSEDGYEYIKDYFDSNFKFLVNEVEIDFESDLWDFSILAFAGKNKYHYKYDFDRFETKSEKDRVKLFVLDTIFTTSIHNTTISLYFRVFKQIFDTIGVNNLGSFSTLKLNVFKRKFNSLLDSSLRFKAIYNNKKYLLTIAIFLEKFENIEFNSEIISFLKVRNIEEINAELKNGKRQLLPSNFIKKLKSKLFDEIMYKPLDYKTLVCYSCIYIGIQTGLRISETTILLYDCIEKERLGKRDYYHFHYRSTKRMSNGYHFGRTKASVELDQIVTRVKSFKSVDNEYLFNFIPDTNIIDAKMVEFCVQHASDFDLYNNIDRNLFVRNIEIGKLRSKPSLRVFIDNKYSDDNYISIPVFSQFRVYFASELASRGVSDFMISKMLNHKDEKMNGYYVNLPKTTQEDMTFSKKIITYIIEDEYKLIGSRGGMYKEIIDNLVANESLKTFRNVTEISLNIMHNIPIRKKLGGFCIKSNIGRSCELDSKTDEFYCAYDLCPNQCSFFFYIDYYYKSFLDNIETYNRALSNNHIQMMQKELFKIKYLISKKVQPLMDELKNEVDHKGEIEVIRKHPNLEVIIKNMENINEEIKIWIEK